MIYDRDQHRRWLDFKAWLEYREDRDRKAERETLAQRDVKITSSVDSRL